MKTIDQYTDEEVAQLSYDDVEKLKMLALAHEGLKIPTEPKAPTMQEVVEPDISVWVAEGTGLEFRAKEAAEAVASILVSNAPAMCKTTYDSKLGYDSKYYYVTNADRWSLENLGAVKEKRVYSPELFKQIKQTAADNKALQDAYKAEMDEYKEQRDNAKEVLEAIDTRISEVEDRFYLLRRHLEHFANYVTIADGDAKQAEKFFVAAYSPSEADLAWVKAQYKTESTKASQ